MGNRVLTLTDSKQGSYFYEEALKTLRANLQFCGRKNKVILFTSVHSNEGKSDITFHLAVELGKSGKKVLLIDADIRKSVYIKRYGVEGTVNGLSQYLSGQIQGADRIVYKTNYENLQMIFAGPHAPNTVEMLEDEQFNQLLKAAKNIYDYVLIDTAPLGSVIDAAVIGQYCDGAVMVVESGNVSSIAAKKVKKQLEKSGCKLLGAVLNKVDMRSDIYYGNKYGKYGKYKYEKSYAE